MGDIKTQLTATIVKNYDNVAIGQRGDFKVVINGKVKMLEGALRISETQVELTKQVVSSKPSYNHLVIGACGMADTLRTENPKILSLAVGQHLVFIESASSGACFSLEEAKRLNRFNAKGEPATMTIEEQAQRNLLRKAVCVVINEDGIFENYKRYIAFDSMAPSRNYVEELGDKLSADIVKEVEELINDIVNHKK